MKEFSVNSGFLYAVTAIVIVYVLAQSAFFLVRAVRRAKQLGIAGGIIRKTIASSALFSVAPAVAILLGVIGSVAGQAGDLTASMLKRYSGIKDYGKLIPGHGGVMDRFDSVIFTLIVMYCYTLVLH